MRILIADDSSTVRNFIADILAEAGLDSVLHARDGIEALAALTMGGIDLALLDWHMPRLSGYEVLDAARKEGCLTPIIMITGDSAADKVRAAGQAGISGYLAKPFKAETLIEKVYRAATIRRDDHPDWFSLRRGPGANAPHRHQFCALTG